MLILGCENKHEETNLNGLPDFFDVKSGEEVTFEIDKGSNNNLPYFYFEVPLSNDSVLFPYMNYSISINKKTNIVHSKGIREPMPTLSDCNKQREFWVKVLEQQNFVLTKEKQAANPLGGNSFLNNSQVATVSCERGIGRGSPFFEIALDVTTNEEHLKFEQSMQQYAANK